MRATVLFHIDTIFRNSDFDKDHHESLPLHFDRNVQIEEIPPSRATPYRRESRALARHPTRIPLLSGRMRNEDRIDRRLCDQIPASFLDFAFPDIARLKRESLRGDISFDSV
jgi:hypothetical protein